MAATVLGVGATTPVGLSAAATAAALRAGIARIGQYAFDPLNEPAVALAWLGDEALPPLARELTTLDERRARLVRLATFPLVEALAGVSEPTAVFLALSSGGLEGDLDHDRSIIADLALQTGVVLDLAASRVFRRGRVGGLLALQEALACIDAGRLARVCIGGVDSHYDSTTLRRLALAGRLRSEDTHDGFVPGEGAAFVLLGPPRSPGVHVIAAAHAGAKPLREGLACAFQALLESVNTPPIQHVYAGATGEDVWAREWGIARLRCAPHFAPDASLDHPAEFIGDAGAALGPLLIALATIGLTRGYRRSPCLVWCGSDSDDRAAALLTCSHERS